jgi:hypothetical protein
MEGSKRLAWKVTFMLPISMVDVLLYEKEGGRSPFADWFDDLDLQAAAKVTIAIERLKLGIF